MDIKFTKSYNVDDYEVLSDVGFVPIKKVHETIPYKVYELEFDNGLVLQCADKHKLISCDDTEVFAKDSLNKKIKTVNGIANVTSIKLLNDCVNMYDLELEYHNKYYTNDILSHNTTTVAAYLLHLALFNKDYNIAILANKKSQAAEVLDRIKTMYQELPWWLQTGVKRWNVQDIVLTNGKKGTSLFTESTQGSSIRGRSVNCLSGDTIVTFQHIETGEEFTFDLKRLYEILDGEELHTDNIRN